VRGFGTRHVELTGIAETFTETEKLAVMVYSYHPQYLGTSSRDVLSTTFNMSGSLSLPWVKNP
ncbi:MAG: hypothetical protein R3194_13190, partial [Limnobacter sp.]|nr:hypothetical protein [Limnobacter sp.]